MKKIVLIVLDGGADRGKDTPYRMAEKPNIQDLAKKGVCGKIDIGYRKFVESDIGFLTLLGFFDRKEYTGRGYLEALGVNLRPKKKEVCIRGNFATLDGDGNVRDRRANREEKGLDLVCDQLDGMEIDGVRIHVKKGSGHRVVIMLEGNVSKDVVPNDPLLEGKPLRQIAASSGKGKFTASVLNKFLYRARKIIEASGINKERKTPANTIIIRNVGIYGETESFEERYGMKACCIAGVPIAKGIARFLGMHVTDVPGATGFPNTDLKAKAEKTAESLKKHDFVWLHINGCDILAHDAKRKEKAEFVGKVDREVIGRLVKKLDMENTVIIITSDHGTDSEKDYRHYRHVRDPVPVLISGDGIRPDEVSSFDEYSCEKGSVKIKGNGLLPFVLKRIRGT